jgi:hypothetical protein
MANFKLSNETVGKIAKGVARLAVCTLAVAMTTLSKKESTTIMYCNDDVEYDDVVSAIMKSDMLSSYKVKAVSMVPKDKTGSLYAAMIQVIKSDMLSSNKIEALEHICEE